MVPPCTLAMQQGVCALAFHHNTEPNLVPSGATGGFAHAVLPTYAAYPRHEPDDKVEHGAKLTAKYGSAGVKHRFPRMRWVLLVR